ncbi:MAG TPA: S49 family peptidase, partial [Vineibacter sp.]|nr:S49 family peptidase [Vineibacter sp.]
MSLAPSQLVSRLRHLGRTPPPLVPVVRLSGVIAAREAFGRSLSLVSVAARLERAFKLRGAKAVALLVNSPGGSPVQSALIGRRIRLLAEEAELPVHVFVEDVAASGGYWLACAGDDIHADAASIVGSIGVLSAGFGFQRLLERWGVERRVHTAGATKAQLDPFRPEDPEDVARLRRLQDDIHADFKAWVRERRGVRLKGDDATLFEGEFWTGRRALELGLIDGIGHLRDVLRARYGEKVQTPLVGERRSFNPLRRLLGMRADGDSGL